ncbi:2228_t:CDS:1, partial [Cetraspora pellucida]
KNKLAKFMQEIGHITNIDVLVKLLSNHSRCKTATQCLQDNDILKQAIIEHIDYKSIQKISTYKQVNKDQQLYILNTLINLTKGSSNNNLESQVSF